MDGLPTLNEKISLEETLHLIDESITKQQKAIDDLLIPLLALKSRRNSIVPISRLPPEIMCRIFSFAQVLHQATTYKLNSLEWINLTYVCRHWRNIAINSPSLWVIPPLENKKWVEEMLRRSKESSLVIRSNTEDVSVEPGLVLALQQSHRIKELSLQNFNLDAWNSIREMLPKSVPRLERLYLEGVEIATSWNFAQPWDPNPLIIWDDILCETESLRQLELDYCQFNWASHSHLFRSLTHLKLKDLLPNSLPNGKQLVDVLKSMPDLELLNLWNALPDHTHQPSLWGSENVHLDHLRSLTVNSVYAEVQGFFRSITFPPTAVVKIICVSDGHTNQDANFSNVIFVLSRSYSATTFDTTFRSLRQYRTSDKGFQLLFFVDAFDLDDIMYTAATAHLDLKMSCDNSDATGKLMTDIFNSDIPLHNIECVFLRDDRPGLNSEIIANTLGLKLPRLRSVIASGICGARQFLHAMHLGTRVRLEEASRSGETSNQELYFPYISSIGLDDITFGMSGHARTLPTELLQNSLVQRCELGTPIERLLLQNCRGISEDDIRSLDEIVVNVNWVDIVDTYSMDEGEEVG